MDNSLGGYLRLCACDYDSLTNFQVGLRTECVVHDERISSGGLQTELLYTDRIRCYQRKKSPGVPAGAFFIGFSKIVDFLYLNRRYSVQCGFYALCLAFLGRNPQA